MRTICGGLWLMGLWPICQIAQAVPTPSLPIVDLPYQRYQASSLNEYGFYNFSNIRFAQPPTGDLRFRAPVPPSGRNDTVDDGKVGRICPQALPLWLGVAPDAVKAVQANSTFYVEAAIAKASSQPPQPDPRMTEDCLFLDVLTPSHLFDRVSATPLPRDSNEGAPVLVWLFPGGFVGGDKTIEGVEKTTLFNTSYETNPDGVVVVSINYRLGAFGWLAGPTVQAETEAQPALYDQQLAFQWVQDNIHLFGGNTDKVTVMGYSAGAGSLVHQLTAFGGQRGPPPFSQAIIQSPGFYLNPGNARSEQTYSDFLELLNVSSLDEARGLPSSALIQANARQVLNAPYGNLPYGPVVDGVFTPALPGELFLRGSFHKDVRVMTAHTADEGLLFTDPRVGDSVSYEAFLSRIAPNISPAAVEYLHNTLYPPNFDGSQGYHTPVERAALTVGEGDFACNAYYIDRAYGNRTYAYEFTIPPGIHTSDLPYEFFDGNRSSVAFPDTAIALQRYLMSFVTLGRPAARGFPVFEEYGPESHILTFNGTATGISHDPVANARCEWWQKALFY